GRDQRARARRLPAVRLLRARARAPRRRVADARRALGRAPARRAGRALPRRQPPQVGRVARLADGAREPAVRRVDGPQPGGLPGEPGAQRVRLLAAAPARGVRALALAARAARGGVDDRRAGRVEPPALLLVRALDRALLRARAALPADCDRLP